ncbi:MAG: hypothetical protein ACI8ZN_001242, partial [Bacteroidia bacterium]
KERENDIQEKNKQTINDYGSCFWHKPFIV